MPVLGVCEIEQQLMGRKSGRERDVNHRGSERESRARRGRRYRSTSYDSRPRSHSAPRLRSGSVASTMSVSSRRSGGRGGQSSHGGENNHGHQNLPSLKNLRKQLRSHYNEKVMAMVARYIDEMELNAEIVNNINYLRRCRHLGIIPKEYWMINSSIRNTREAVRMLDECSYRLMCHDQQYHMLRRAQLTKQLARTEDQLKKLLSQQDHQRLCAVVKEHRSGIFSHIRDEQRKAVDSLRKEVEDYQSYLKEKKKPRRNAADGAGNNSHRRTRNKNKENRLKDDIKNSISRSKSEDDDNISHNNNTGSRDSDGEDPNAHRVERRTAGSASSREDGSVSDE
ncbi:uncharacterized protein LOC111267348 isoform X1 [Varroa jacobsoni]|uniref:Uncharacterized protein n=1 Tax=Varroa destructor TaxID=109461 RepID=A0A7M7MD21_VARDE|nr:uncharacterized protein LOC111246950 isoform X1 [Varroa destructor]XP_022701287.1 uncharacterized protein LOC111267348 isoform X1 [Varroa jacobsoni]